MGRGGAPAASLCSDEAKWRAASALLWAACCRCGREALMGTRLKDASSGGSSSCTRMPMPSAVRYKVKSSVTLKARCEESIVERRSNTRLVELAVSMRVARGSPTSYSRPVKTCAGQSLLSVGWCSIGGPPASSGTFHSSEAIVPLLLSHHCRRMV